MISNKFIFYLIIIIFLLSKNTFSLSKDYKFTLLKKDLNSPWSISFINENEIIISEKTGKIKLLNLINDNIVEMSKYSPNGELCRRCSRDHGDYYHIIRKYDSNNNVIYFRGSDSCGNEESFNKYDSKNNMIESISTNDTRWGVKYTYEYDLLDSLIKVSKFHNNNIDTNDDWEEVIYD